MQGKVVLITGATSGLGLAAAEGLARLGATVWLVVRSPERGEHARERIAERSGNGNVHVGLCDLSKLKQRRCDVAVYELPDLSSSYRPARWLIDGGMTRGIPDASARARTVTVYTDVRNVVENRGLPGTETVAVLIVERSGRILASEVGGFEQQKAGRLAAALVPAPSPGAGRDMSDDTVLVTGATGFIGARLAATLASSRRTVRCLVRDRGGTRARALEREQRVARPLAEVLEFFARTDNLERICEFRRQAVSRLLG